MEPVGGTWDPARALQVSYKCNEGYELVGEGINQCDPKTGHWSTSLPECQLKPKLKPKLSYGKVVGLFHLLIDLTRMFADDFCGQPPVVEHGTLIEPQTFNFSEILKVSYKCGSGYELVGNETIDCDIQNGRWNSDAPTCHQIVESSPLEVAREESGNSNLVQWIGGTFGVLAAVPTLGYLIYVARRE